MTTWPGPIREAFARGTLVAWFLVTRMQQFLASKPMSFSDSASYFAKAGERVLSVDFFFGEGRLPTIPLFWAPWVRWYGEDGAILSCLQFGLSCSSWLLLATAVCRHLQTSLGRIAGRGLVLILASSSAVTQWDRALLSESLSTSLFVALMAAWLGWGNQWIAQARSTRATVGTIIALGTLWGFARESNGIFLLMLGAIALLLVITWAPSNATATKRLRIQGIVIAMAFAAVFALAQLTAERGERWLFPLLNVIGRRVLPSQERTAFYAAAGMPLSPALMAMSGEFGSGRDWSFYHAAELADFRVWVRSHGRHTYARDLVLHPERTLSEPLVHAREFLCPDLTIYRPPGFSPAPLEIEASRFCSDGTATRMLAVALLGGILGSVGGLIFRRRISFATFFLGQTIALLMVAWPILTWLTWHAIGEMEVDRHVLWATLFFRLGCVLAAAWLVDLIVRFLADVRTRTGSVGVRSDPT